MSLTIKDLAVAEELSAKEMSAVRGGYLALPLYYWGGYSSDSSVKNFSFDAAGQVNQGQSVATNVGNNVAVLGGFASPSVPVTASQTGNITNNVAF